jgi:hypothetical protein
MIRHQSFLPKAFKTQNLLKKTIHTNLITKLTLLLTLIVPSDFGGASEKCQGEF